MMNAVLTKKLCRLSLSAAFALSALHAAPAAAKGITPADINNDGKPFVKPTHMKDFNIGWGPSFKKLEKMLSPEKDYVSWIIEEPPFAMDLRSGEHFRRSIIANEIDDSSISHMMVQWQCHTPDGKVVRGGAAQTGEDSNQTTTMIKAGWGESAFFAAFTDGYLNTPEDIEDTVTEVAKKNFPVAHVTLEVSRAKCNDMLNFLDAYLKSPKKPFTKFALNLRPLNFEGGGCGSFASALLTHAGVFSKIQPLMWRALTGSTNVMGSGLELPVSTVLQLPKRFKTEHKYVWMGTFQMTPWTLNDGPTIHLVDPELGIFALRTFALEYARSQHKSASSLEGTGFLQRSLKGAHWKNVATDEVGDGSYVEENTTIDETYDAQAAVVAEQTREEYRALQNAGMKIRSVKIGNYPGLLITK